MMEREGFIWLNLPVHHCMKSGQELKQGLEVESMKEHCLLTHSQVQAIIPTHLRTICPGDGSTHSGLGRAISPKSQGSLSQT